MISNHLMIAMRYLVYLDLAVGGNKRKINSFQNV